MHPYFSIFSFSERFQRHLFLLWVFKIVVTYIFFCAFVFREMTSSFISALDLQTVLIGLVVLLLIYILRQRWKNKKYKLPPGPPALPLIGNYEGEFSALLVPIV